MRTRPASQRRQRGVAALIVVMVLFFIVSLVAAYASRNLIFEQRTSTNQLRSTQALEAADAGLEWALTQLNAGRIDDDCAPSADNTKTSFRDRYLSFDGNSGNITPRKGASDVFLYPTCVLDGNAWTCSCPVDGAPTTAVPTTAGVHPAFRLFFKSLPTVQPGIVQLFAAGCTRLNDECLKFNPIGSTTNISVGASNEGLAGVSILVAVAGGPSSTPVATLTARGSINLGGAALAAYNADAASGGIAVQAGGAVNDVGLLLGTVAGSPPGSVLLQNDPGLGAVAFTADRMFAGVFNVWRATFRSQPATVVLTCGGGTCAAATVRDAIAGNPGRPIWVQGDLVLDTAGDLGTANAPVLLTVTGDLDFGAVNATIYGLVYVQAANWASAGAATVRGAVVAEGSISGNMAPVLIYDGAVLNLLRTNTGSFVRVPGSWKDFP